MSLFVLVVIGFFLNGDRKTQTADYPTYEACEQAGKDFVTLTQISPIPGLYDVESYCIKSEKI